MRFNVVVSNGARRRCVFFRLSVSRKPNKSTSNPFYSLPTHKLSVDCRAAAPALTHAAVVRSRLPVLQQCGLKPANNWDLVFQQRAGVVHHAVVEPIVSRYSRARHNGSERFVNVRIRSWHICHQAAPYQFAGGVIRANACFAIQYEIAGAKTPAIVAMDATTMIWGGGCGNLASSLALWQKEQTQ